MEFINYHKMHKTPIAIYADFECYLEKIDIQKGKKTRAYQQHKPSGFCLYVTRFDGKNYGVQYTGRTDVGRRFTDEVEKITQDFYDEFKIKKPLIDIANEAYENETNCYACGGILENVRTSFKVCRE